MTSTLSRENIDNMEQRYRANLINSLSGFKPAVLLGTTDGHTNNLAIVSSVVHIGANPPLLGMIMRPHSVQRDSLGNIKKSGFYTLNHVHTDWVEKAHQTSARYASDESEFDAVGLTPLITSSFPAPFVEESNLRIGLKVAQHFTLINDTEMVIGEIQELHVNEDHIASDGYLDIEASMTACISGLDSYHSTTRLAQFEYAKPNLKPRRK